MNSHDEKQSKGIFYLDGKWRFTGRLMSGVVKQNGKKVSTDFWRQDGKRVERFAFTSSRMFVKIEGSGWDSNRMILIGTTNDKTGESKIRETITKINDRKFHALWEMQNSDGKWIIFADEICTKWKVSPLKSELFRRRGWPKLQMNQYEEGMWSFKRNQRKFYKLDT